MPFGPTNAPATFMDVMNSFKPHMDKFVVVFTFWCTHKFKEEHEQHLQISLQLLRDHRLYAKLSKFDFWLEQVTFLGHVISKERVTMNIIKIRAIVNWDRPTNVTEVMSFLGLVGYFRWFVKGFSSLAASITKITHKNAKFVWCKDSEKCFCELEDRLTTALVLTLPSGSGGFDIYSDASLCGLGCVDAEWKSGYSCYSAAESTRKELSDSWFGTSNSCVRVENLETLSLWRNFRGVHGP